MKPAENTKQINQFVHINDCNKFEKLICTKTWLIRTIYVYTNTNLHLSCFKKRVLRVQ